MKRWSLFGAIWFATASMFAQTQPKDWAKFNRYAQANEELKANGTAIDAVFMGNSITDHWAQDDPNFFSNNQFVGRGIGGQTTSKMLIRFRQDVLELHHK